MKKKFKQLISLIVVCMMMVSTLTMTAGAQTIDPAKTTGTLTLTGEEKKTDSVYSAYKVLTPLSHEGQSIYEYELTDAFKNVGYTVDQIAAFGDGPDDYHIDMTKADKLASDLENYVNANAVQAAYELTAETKTEVEIGYYLIVETTITEGYKTIKPMLVAVPSENPQADYNYDVTVTLKEQPLITTKTIVESETERAESAAQQVGKEFNFEVTQDIPLYDDTYKNVVFKVADKMGKGLTFVDIVSVEVVKADGSRQTLTEDQYGFQEPIPEGEGTKIVFDFSDHTAEGGTDFYDYVKSGDQVVITYTAKLNKDAEFGTTANVNEVAPTFGRDPETVTDGTPDRTETFSGVLQLTKKDENKDPLEGATFEIFTDAECKTPAELVTYKVVGDQLVQNETFSSKVVTDATGIVKFAGLDEGTYYIKETDTPTGYVKLKNPIKVTVTFDKETKTFSYAVEGNGVDKDTISMADGMVTFDVLNARGFTLPTTGGMGTYIFTIGGVVLIAAAVLLLVRLRKKAK